MVHLSASISTYHLAILYMVQGIAFRSMALFQRITSNNYKLSNMPKPFACPSSVHSVIFGLNWKEFSTFFEFSGDPGHSGTESCNREVIEQWFGSYSIFSCLRKYHQLGKMCCPSCTLTGPLSRCGPSNDMQMFFITIVLRYILYTAFCSAIP